ncbi:FEKKY domain-containing protein [Chitinophaga niabensis]|uniref:Uncharacterized protein n=1 Tax=Chitinophaga niabensis TaxID=536979 RepID=A0A1N6K0L1_9BACT|nr:hypothetical protein [Chitinophaga niabensis]SIO50134.1 hypothetical protein SAMN04488055_4844 [Chitinophaga niabensis]
MRSILLVWMIFTVSCLQKAPDKRASAVKKDETALLWTDYRIGELPPEGYYDAIDSVVKKWNINYKRVEGGCEATVKDKEKHEAGNAGYFQELEKQYGKHWREQFNKEVRELDSILKSKKVHLVE